jgi:hypothetical protein
VGARDASPAAAGAAPPVRPVDADVSVTVFTADDVSEGQQAVV